MEDLISVIVPVYGVEKYIHRCIDSILNQTYKNLEIILVNDGSLDSCPEICDEYKKKDRRIKVIHKENGGQDSARKAGINIASGRFIGYVDADDWIEPDMYEKLLCAMIKYNVDIVESGIIDSTENSHVSRLPAVGTGVYRGEGFDNNVGSICLYSGKFFSHGIFPYLVTKLFKREVIYKYQTMEDRSNNIGDDVMCVMPCVLSSRSIAVISDCLYHYRIREGSTKRKSRTDIKGVLRACYNDWLGRLSIAKAQDNIKKQLDYFVLYLLLSKGIEIFDNGIDAFVPFGGGINSETGIILYGAGMVGINYKRYIDRKGLKLIAWVDKNYKNLGQNLPISDPRTIQKRSFDYIIISVLSHATVQSIKRDLIDMGVTEEKILWVKNEYIDRAGDMVERKLFSREVCNAKNKYSNAGI